MPREGWSEYCGRIIGATLPFGTLSAIAGVTWGLALGFDIVAGAMWGGIIGGGIVFILSLGISRKATAGMMIAFGPPSVIAVAIGLVVWLIRSPHRIADLEMLLSSPLRLPFGILFLIGSLWFLTGTIRSLPPGTYRWTYLHPSTWRDILLGFVVSAIALGGGVFLIWFAT